MSQRLIAPASGAVDPGSGALDPLAGALDPVAGALDPATGVINFATGAITKCSGAIDPVSGGCEICSGRTTEGAGRLEVTHDTTEFSIIEPSGRLTPKISGRTGRATKDRHPRNKVRTIKAARTGHKTARPIRWIFLLGGVVHLESAAETHNCHAAMRTFCM